MRSCESNFRLQALQDGNPGAFKEVYNEYYPLLFRKALYMLEDEFKAQDVVHDVFATLWERRSFKRINKSLKAYLYIAVHNGCLRVLQISQKHCKEQEAYQYAFEQQGADRHFCDVMEKREEQAFRQELLSTLRLAGTALSPMQRVAVTKVFYEEKSYSESASALGISVDTFHTHISRALQKFRKFLRVEL